MQKEMGTALHFSISFHPQSDGQSERVIQILEVILWGCVMDLKSNWEDHLPLVEFSNDYWNGAF